MIVGHGTKKVFLLLIEIPGLATPKLITCKLTITMQVLQLYMIDTEFVKQGHSAYNPIHVHFGDK